jgi:hypothetical protein
MARIIECYRKKNNTEVIDTDWKKGGGKLHCQLQKRKVVTKISLSLR